MRVQCAQALAALPSATRTTKASRAAGMSRRASGIPTSSDASAMPSQCASAGLPRLPPKAATTLPVAEATTVSVPGRACRWAAGVRARAAVAWRVPALAPATRPELASRGDGLARGKTHLQQVA